MFVPYYETKQPLLHLLLESRGYYPLYINHEMVVYMTANQQGAADE